MESDLNKKSVDEVDFVKPDICLPCSQNSTETKTISLKGTNNNNQTTNETTPAPSTSSPSSSTKFLNKCYFKRGTMYGDCESKAKSSFDKLPMFHFPLRKKSDPTNNCTTQKEKSKFVKSASIARLLGNTYSTNKPAAPIKSVSSGERFKKSSQFENNSDQDLVLKDLTEDRDLGAKALRSLTRGLGRLLRRRTTSVDISSPDPEFKVAYLGNVLTGWAKGDGCFEKPLATLWRNYTQHCKPDVLMRIKVCSSGLKATTKQHGLTEYWAHRITHSCSPKNYPRVFCWIYRHEGRKLKHEMRCHAVLCAKESIAKEISIKLQDNLTRALAEFKRDKVSRQNARLSLANSIYENPTIPRRKIMLSVGANNYRPPLERSKSAPKLMAIEEMVGEEDEEDEEEKVVDNRKSCCKQDNLYPAMTLGRRRCRRGHSIRRSGRRRVGFKVPEEVKAIKTEENEEVVELRQKIVSSISTESEEDFDNLLLENCYDTNEPLSGELMSYFDMKMKPNTGSLTNIHKPNILECSTIRNSQSLDDLDNYSDVESEHEDSVFFNQSDILEILRKSSNQQQRNSNEMIKNDLANSKLTPVAASEHDDCAYGFKNEISLKISTKLPSMLLMQNSVLDSDEGSISSGCETLSTVTTTTDDLSMKQEIFITENDIILEPVGEKNSLLVLKKDFRRSVTYPCKEMEKLLEENMGLPDSDSELSDESGYVEFQETRQHSITKNKPVIA